MKPLPLLHFLAALALLECRASAAEPGKALWQYSAGEEILPRSPTVGPDGTVYVETPRSSLLHAVLPSGKKKWEKKRLYFGLGPTISTEGTLYLSSYTKGRMYAYDASLKELWNFQTGAVAGSLAASTPIQALQRDGRVVIGAGESVYSIKRNATVDWSLDLPPSGHFFGPPAIAPDGTIYVASGISLHAIGPTGKLKWSSSGFNQPLTSLAIDFNGAVYYGWSGADYELVCVGPDSQIRWRIILGKRGFTGNPVIGIDGTVYVPGADSGMNAIDPKGQLMWVYPLQHAERFFTSAVVGEDGLIYFGDSSNTLYALKADGTLAWSRISIGGAGPPALAPDGTLYAIAGSNLFAVSTSSKGMARSAWPCESHDLRNTRSAELPIAQRAFGASKMEGGSVTAVTVYESGNGYDAGTTPRVILTGDGYLASAHAVVQDGRIIAIEIDEPGYGYTVPPQVTIGSPPFAPELRIHVETVRVEMRLILGELYQLQTSMDLVGWAPVEEVFTPKEENLVRTFNVRDYGQFFRVLRIPRGTSP